MEIQKKPRSNLFLERFKRGLWNWYKLTLEELTENYKYCGGDGDNASGDERHHNYWVTLFGNEKCPYKETECFCGQQIRENCFVVDKTKTNFVHMGNCCIKRFMPEGKSGRTCEICEEPHKNRKDNLNLLSFFLSCVHDGVCHIIRGRGMMKEQLTMSVGRYSRPPPHQKIFHS